MSECTYVRKHEICTNENNCGFKLIDNRGRIICKLKGELGEMNKESWSIWDKHVRIY